jgi:hypothetical protein
MILEEVACEHCRDAPLNISGGTIIDPENTLRFHQIADSQKVIVFVPSSALPWGPDLSAKDFCLPQVFNSRTPYGFEDEEIAQEADHDFTNWEYAPTCQRPPMPTVLLSLEATGRGNVVDGSVEAEFYGFVVSHCLSIHKQINL